MIILSSVITHIPTPTLMCIKKNRHLTTDMPVGDCVGVMLSNRTAQKLKK